VNLTAWSGHFFTIFGNSNSPTFVPPPLWPVIHAEILNQCDGIDGVVDGIIEDPLLCQWRPEALQCAPGIINSTTCLTSTQVGAVRAAFTDYYGTDGSLIYPRMQPGSEIIASSVYYNGEPFSYSTDWFRYAVYSMLLSFSICTESGFDSSIDDPNWDPSKLNLTDVNIANAQNPFDIQTFNGDLSAFQNAGGKVRKYYVHSCSSSH